MIRTIVTALALVATLCSSPAYAYWEYGHETIAKIAYRNAAPATRARIDAMLRQSRLLETPTCPARTIEQASVWADCIKRLDQRFNYASSWHYQNVDVCKPFDLKSACRDGNCVSAQIERGVKLLQDTAVPMREKVQALAFLIHFVGDLHQPLHAGDRGDLGGNRVRAAYGVYAPERFNLHSLWDGPLAERAISTPPEIIRDYSSVERAEFGAGSVEDWSREAWGVSKDFAYATAMGGDPCAKGPERSKLDDATVAKLVAPARDQVMKGGVRLARLLDEAFGPPPPKAAPRR